MADAPETRDPVEVVRRANEAWNRRDLDSLLRLLSPEVVYRPLANFTESAERRGHEQFRRFAEEFLEPWAEDFTTKLDTVRLYGDAVIARVLFTGHSRGSGVEISERMFIVYRVRDGLITRWEDFADRQDALRAAGASDEPMSAENVKIVRRAFEAATRRPKPDFATVNALYHPDHELSSATGRLEGTEPLRGAAGFRELLATTGEAMSWESAVERLSAIDDDRVLLTWRVTARGSQSGAPTEQRLAAIVTVRDGKVTRTENYSSVEQALEAAGLDH